MQDPVRLVWSLTQSGLGTTLTASGSSGAWNSGSVPGGEPVQNQRTPVDLRWADDFWLSVCVQTVTGSSPSLQAQLNLFDDQGNLLTYLTGTTPFLAPAALTGEGAAVAFGGRHGGGSSGSYFVAPEWGQVAWKITGTTPVFAGTEIALYAR